MIEPRYISWIYREEIYLIAETAAPAKPAQVIGSPYFGDNKEQFSIFIESTDLDFYKTEDFSFLCQVMEAISLTPSEYVVINLSAYAVESWEQVQQTFSPRTVLSFTEKTRSFLAVRSAKYTPHLSDHLRCLAVDSLSVIREDRDLKKKLWQGLKELVA